jgi:transposase InsO family protein
MGQVLHPQARTTEAIRQEIQNSQESIAKLANRYGVNPKTVAKWKNRDSVKDLPMGPKQPRSTILTAQEEAMIVAFRTKTLLSLDDCLYALQETMPHLTRASLHRCFRRHGVNRLPQSESKPAKKPFKAYPIGYFHLDICHLSTAEGKLYLFVAIDRTSKFVFAELLAGCKREDACAFLQRLIPATPYQIHTILTDNGRQFTQPANAKQRKKLDFSKICDAHGIQHRLTKPYHPWTNGQVERMHQTIKEQTVYRYFYQTHLRLHQHLEAFIQAYNFAKRLKALQGRTPYEFICDKWRENPAVFYQHPHHLKARLNI